MARRQVGRRKKGSGKERVKTFRRDRSDKGGQIGLKFRGVLALGEERAGLAPLILVEEMVDKVRRKRDQVGDEQAGGQRACQVESPGTAEPCEHPRHFFRPWGCCQGRLLRETPCQWPCRDGGLAGVLGAACW